MAEGLPPSTLSSVWSASTSASFSILLTLERVVKASLVAKCTVCGSTLAASAMCAFVGCAKDPSAMTEANIKCNAKLWVADVAGRKAHLVLNDCDSLRQLLCMTSEQWSSLVEHVKSEVGEMVFLAGKAAVDPEADPVVDCFRMRCELLCQTTCLAFVAECRPAPVDAPSAANTVWMERLVECYSGLKN